MEMYRIWPYDAVNFDELIYWVKSLQNIEHVLEQFDTYVNFQTNTHEHTQKASPVSNKFSLSNSAVS